MIWKIVLGLVALILGFIIWRWTSIARGAQKRDELILARLAPVGDRLEAGEDASAEELSDLAAQAENRFFLHAVLEELKRTELFPTGYDSTVSQGESALCYWMMHPNELQAPPEAIEFLETVKRSVEGTERDFHVYRYKMPAGHWGAQDGWQLGVAGPMFDESKPYSEMPGAFARVGDKEGQINPSEIVDWYVDMLRQKGVFGESKE